MAPPTGLEPVTSWLTVMRSTDWAMEEYLAFALCWHLPIFTHRRQCTIFGTTELNFRVRYGNGWTLSVIDTNYFRRKKRHIKQITCSSTVFRQLTKRYKKANNKLLFIHYSLFFIHWALRKQGVSGDSCGNRTRVAGVRGRSLNRLTNEPYFWQRARCEPLVLWCTIRGSNPGHPD